MMYVNDQVEDTTGDGWRSEQMMAIGSRVDQGSNQEGSGPIQELKTN